MKKRIALPTVIALAMTALSSPVSANTETRFETGFVIRIGDSCYIDIMGYLMPFPCPREVSPND
jgi:hypothetical protein